MFLILLPLLFSSALSATPDRACIELSACATKQCLNKRAILSKIDNSTSVSAFETIVTSFDMLCITTKCTNQCTLCGSCQYAIQQMAAFATGSSTGGMCPKLESCISKCIDGDDIKDIVNCVNRRCNVMCYNGSCDTCKALSKRIFTRFCREANLVEQSAFSHFKGTCPSLFDSLSVQFVNSRKL